MHGRKWQLRENACFFGMLVAYDRLLRGAGENTLVLINSTEPPENYAGIGNFKIATINGMSIAQNNKLGRVVNAGR